jgi:hypothetical protein
MMLRLALNSEFLLAKFNYKTGHISAAVYEAVVLEVGCCKKAGGG